VDKQAIQRLLRRYEDAYNRKDTDAISKLVPNSKLGKDPFKYTESYHVVLEKVSIDVSGDRATVTCERQITAVSKDRGPATRTEQKLDTNIRLRRGGADWVIESVK